MNNRQDKLYNLHVSNKDYVLFNGDVRNNSYVLETYSDRLKRYNKSYYNFFELASKYLFCISTIFYNVFLYSQVNNSKLYNEIIKYLSVYMYLFLALSAFLFSLSIIFRHIYFSDNSFYNDRSFIKCLYKPFLFFIGCIGLHFISVTAFKNIKLLHSSLLTNNQYTSMMLLSWAISFSAILYLSYWFYRNKYKNDGLFKNESLLCMMVSSVFISAFLIYSSILFKFNTIFSSKFINVINSISLITSIILFSSLFLYALFFFIKLYSKNKWDRLTNEGETTKTKHKILTALFLCCIPLSSLIINNIDIKIVDLKGFIFIGFALFSLALTLNRINTLNELANKNRTLIVITKNPISESLIHTLDKLLIFVTPIIFLSCTIEYYRVSFVSNHVMNLFLAGSVFLFVNLLIQAFQKLEFFTIYNSNINLLKQYKDDSKYKYPIAKDYTTDIYVPPNSLLNNDDGNQLQSSFKK